MRSSFRPWHWTDVSVHSHWTAAGRWGGRVMDGRVKGAGQLVRRSLAPTSWAGVILGKVSRENVSQSTSTRPCSQQLSNTPSVFHQTPHVTSSLPIHPAFFNSPSVFQQAPHVTSSLPIHPVFFIKHPT